jgi:ubiquinone/menaquinone biosynthesis C-methylase UbiE
LSKTTDRNYLLSTQYRDAANLNARIELHSRFSTNRQGYVRWLFERLTLPGEARILDIGCGPATIWQDNLIRIPEGWEITLADFSEGMLAEALRNLRDSGREFRFTVADVQHLPFEDSSLDAVVANFMLYHVPDLNKGLAEIRRVLRSGGRLFAGTFGRGHMRELDDLVRRFDPGIGIWGSEPGEPSPSYGNNLTEAFGLETGAEKLSPWFADVKVHRFEDALIVTEATPLVAYVQSMAIGPSVTAGRLAEFTHFIESELARLGSIYIGKEPGLFEARKTDDQRRMTRDE